MAMAKAAGRAIRRAIAGPSHAVRWGQAGYKNDKAYPQGEDKDQADQVRDKQKAQAENGADDEGCGKKKHGGAWTADSDSCHSLGEGKAPPVSDGSGFQSVSHG